MSNKSKKPTSSDSITDNPTFFSHQLSFPLPFPSSRVLVSSVQPFFSDLNSFSSPLFYLFFSHTAFMAQPSGLGLMKKQWHPWWLKDSFMVAQNLDGEIWGSFSYLLSATHRAVALVSCLPISPPPSPSRRSAKTKPIKAGLASNALWLVEIGHTCRPPWAISNGFFRIFAICKNR